MARENQKRHKNLGSTMPNGDFNREDFYGLSQEGEGCHHLWLNERKIEHEWTGQHVNTAAGKADFVFPSRVRVDHKMLKRTDPKTKPIQVHLLKKYDAFVLAAYDSQNRYEFICWFDAAEILNAIEKKWVEVDAQHYKWASDGTPCPTAIIPVGRYGRKEDDYIARIQK